MKDKNWSYLAGLIDGEGHISLARSRKHREHEGHTVNTLIGITNRSHELMKWLIKNFGGVYYHRSYGNGKWADRYDWMIKGKNNKEIILLGILPYLIIKRKQALLMIEFLRLELKHPEKRQELMAKLHELNRRGPSLTTNTSDVSNEMMIEPELIGDNESAPVVT